MHSAPADVGIPGLVRGVRNAVGSSLHMHVLEYDPVLRRFSAEPA